MLKTDTNSIWIFVVMFASSLLTVTQLTQLPTSLIKTHKSLLTHSFQRCQDQKTENQKM